MMAAKALWKGSINFAMVSIQAKLYKATDDKSKQLSFHQYHKGKCGGRIKMPKTCGKCDKLLDASDIEKGYEVSDTQHLVFTEQDFASLPLKTLKQIEVCEFVDARAIDTRAITDSYFLTCEDTGAKAFTLFLRAMEQANLVAMAKLTYRERERLVCIRAYDGIMLLQTLHYEGEMRSYDDLRPLVAKDAISEKEMAMASQLLETMTAEFDVERDGYGYLVHKYKDEYHEAMERLIEAKMNGKTIEAPDEPKAPVEDVADALIASIGLAKAKKAVAA
jgi:DNA end-binding protein Ku